MQQIELNLPARIEIKDIGYFEDYYDDWFKTTIAGPSMDRIIQVYNNTLWPLTLLDGDIELYIIVNTRVKYESINRYLLWKIRDIFGNKEYNNIKSISIIKEDIEGINIIVCNK